MHDHAVLQLLHTLGPAGVLTLCLLALILVKSRKARRALARAVGRAMRRAFRSAYRGAVLSLRCARLRVPLRVARRLDRREWRAMVEQRQLSGLVRGRVVRTKLGLRIHVHLTGSLTLETLNTRTGQLVTGLGVRPKSVRVQPNPKRADRAVVTIVLRDPHAKPLLWKRPAPASIRRPALLALTEHGEPVMVRLLQRIVIGGSSGAGKSTVIRALAVPVVLAPDAELVYIDPKGVEGSLWRGVAEVLVTPDEIRAGIARLEARMRARLDDMAARGVANHTPSVAEPAVVLIVDEGAELTRAGLGDEIARLESLAQLGRAAEFRLWWASQYLTAKSGGLPRGIGSQAECTIGLRVQGPLENRVMFDETAERTGWKANELPDGGGWLMLKDADHPDPERSRAYYATDEDVRALPRPQLPAQRAEALEDAVPADALPVAPAAGVPTPTSADAGNGESNRQRATGKADLVLAELLVADGALSGRRIAELIGSNPGTAKRLLDRLAADGAIRSTDSGWELVLAAEPALNDSTDNEMED